MRTFDDICFESRYDRPLWPWQRGRSFEDAVFRRCVFENICLSLTRDPRRRSHVRNVTVTDCEVGSVGIGPVIVEDVQITNLKTRLLVQTWGAVFRHVTFSGKIGQVMFSPIVAPGNASPAEQQAFDQANAAFYETVDWALDIREAAFRDADLRGVPGNLVRRDPATQMLITREAALRGDWRQLDLAKTHWPLSIRWFLEDSRLESIVLVAPKRAPDFDRLLAGLMLLREAGVAEPD